MLSFLILVGLKFRLDRRSFHWSSWSGFCKQVYWIEVVSVGRHLCWGCQLNNLHQSWLSRMLLNTSLKWSRKKKVGLARKSRGCVWYVFVNSTVPFHHRWVEEKGGNLNPEYFLSLHAIHSIALLCTYRVVYCSTFEKEYKVFFFFS